MNNFLSDLYSYISERTFPIKNDPEYNQAVEAYRELEEEVKEKIGADLLYQYQHAEAVVSYLRSLAMFSKTLRFSQKFFLAVLD